MLLMQALKINFFFNAKLFLQIPILNTSFIFLHVIYLWYHLSEHTIHYQIYGNYPHCHLNTRDENTWQKNAKFEKQ